MKILVVGVKGFGKMHLSALNRLNNLEIDIVERDNDVINFVKSKYNINNVYSNYDSALKNKYDIIDLIIPHNLHLEFGIKALKTGANLLMEKPISTNPSDGLKIIREAKKNGTKFMVLDQYFFDPSVVEAKNIIKSGKLGRIHSIIVRDQRFYSKTGWRQQPEYIGGGSLIDGGIHYINTMLEFGGNYNNIIGKSMHGGSSLNGEDTTSALFLFSSGAMGLLYYSWAYMESPQVPAFEVIGSEGSLYEDPKSRTDWDIDTKIRTVYGDLCLNGRKMNIKKYDVYTREISEFIDAVKNNEEVPFKPEMELRDLIAVKRIYNNMIS